MNTLNLDRLAALYEKAVSVDGTFGDAVAFGHEIQQTFPALLEAARRAQQWQPMDTAPKDGTWVLLTGGKVCDDAADIADDDTGDGEFDQVIQAHRSDARKIRALDLWADMNPRTCSGLPCQWPACEATGVQCPAKAQSASHQSSPTMTCDELADRVKRGEKWQVAESPQEPAHINTDECGFDRNESISQDTYVCLCGWPFNQSPPEQASRPDTELSQDKPNGHTGLPAPARGLSAVEEQHISERLARCLQVDDAIGAEICELAYVGLKWRDNSSLEEWFPFTANELDRLRSENARLERLVYVPGVWKCAKCDLRLVISNLHADSGKISANNEPQPCANGCGPMWRVTERDAGNDLCDRLDKAADELAKLRSEREWMVSVPREAIQWIQNAHDELWPSDPKEMLAHALSAITQYGKS